MTRARMFGVAVAVVFAAGRASSGLMAADAPASPAANPPAQARETGRGMIGSGLALLRSDVVAKDLALTDEQTEAVKKLGDDARKQMTGLRDSLKDATREERAAKMADAEKDIAKKVDAVLNETQRARLQEIKLQVRGPAALTDKEVADALKLSEEQVRKLTELAEARRSAVRAAIEAAAGDRTAAREKVGQIAKDAADKMMDVLTSDQKEAFEKMKGKKLDLGTAGFGSLGGPGRGPRNSDTKPESKPDSK